MKQWTPIAVFAYNRPDHLRKTLEALEKCRRLDECRVFIYCDGPRLIEHESKVRETRMVAREWGDVHNTELIERDENLGLAKSIVTGVTQLCEQYGRVIVLEDDLIVSSVFLDFMLQSLDHYENEERVFQVGGFLFSSEYAAKTDAFLMPITTSWGWATWQRAWKNYSRNPEEAAQALKDPDILHRFNLGGTYQFANMLLDNIAGKNNSWGVWWWWSVFNQDGLVVYPSSSLVFNAGFDGTGEHCGDLHLKNIQTRQMKKFADKIEYLYPEKTEVNLKAFYAHKKSLINKSHGTDQKIVFRLINRILRRKRNV